MNETAAPDPSHHVSDATALSVSAALLVLLAIRRRYGALLRRRFDSDSAGQQLALAARRCTRSF